LIGNIVRSATIVMYHYVREIKNSRYPRIRGLEVKEFEEQLVYLKRYYQPITAEDLFQAVSNNERLPPNAVLLTFDDAYSDHFSNVFPLLVKHGFSGCFFPAADSIMNHRLLDVNKIQFTLAVEKNIHLLVEAIFEMIQKNRELHNLESDEYYWNEFATPNRWDTEEVMFVKKILQKGLNEDLRKTIIDKLFSYFVSEDETAFSNELYMSMDQLKCLKECGMYIGSHGNKHNWLASLSAKEQEQEIDSSLDFLENLGVDRFRWMMCFPYGSYNQDTLRLLKEKNCIVGLTTRVGLMSLADNPLEMPRLDTNDLPKVSDSQPNKWTRAVL